MCLFIGDLTVLETCDYIRDNTISNVYCKTNCLEKTIGDMVTNSNSSINSTFQSLLSIFCVISYV